MTTIEQLLIEIRLQGAQATKQQLRDIHVEAGKIEGAFRFLGSAGGVLVFASALRDILSVFSEISGLNIAAKFTGIALSLEAVTGSLSETQRLMRELKQLGKETPFDTAEVAAFAAQMIGAGTATHKVMGELRTLLDMAAFAQVPREALGSVLFNLQQIKSMGQAKASFADIRQMLSRAPGSARILAAGLGIPQSELIPKLRGRDMSGSEVYEALLRGSEALAKGAAAARALRDPVAALANLFETLKMIMEPTGQILIRILSPAMRFAQWLANLLQWLNEISKGFFGLAALLGGALWLATRAATKALWEFVAAMLATAGASRGAAGAAAGTAIGALGTGAAGGAAVGLLPRMWGWMKTMLPRIIRFSIWGAVIAGIGEAIRYFVRGDGKNQSRNEAATLLKWTAIGAGIGALIGQIPGALIGALIGMLTGAIENRFFGGGKVDTDKGDAMLDEQKKTNRHLEEIKSKTFGAGPRTAAGISMFETEYAIAKAFGIG